jgi:hypothetical protein
MVIGAFMLFPVLAFVALGLDTGFEAKDDELAQSTCDSAVLAAVESLATNVGGGEAASNNAAWSVVQLNGYTQAETTITYYDASGAGGDATAGTVATVSVGITHIYSTTLLAAFSHQYGSVSDSAKATVPPPPGGNAPAGGSNIAGTTADGDGSSGTTGNSGDNGRMVGNRLLIPSPGEVFSQMQVYFLSPQASPNNSFEVAVYSDVESSPGQGKPGNLIASSAVGTISAAGYNTATFSSSVTLQPMTYYWFMVENKASIAADNEVEYYTNTNPQVTGNVLGAEVTVSGLPGSFPSWPATAAAPSTSGPFAYYMNVVFPTIGSYWGNTIGYDLPLWVTDTGEQNSVEGNHVYTGGSAFVVSALSAYYTGTVCASGNNFQMAIYSDSSGTPKTMLATSSTGTIVANSWVTVTMNLTLAASSSYWILINNGGSGSPANCDNLAIGPQANERGGYGGVTYGTWPATYAAGWTTSSVVYSFYASCGIAGGSAQLIG